jgi:DNA-binding NtrC family response regulator
MPKILIVDDVAENRFLLAKTLLRKFPRGVIQECENSAPALAAARNDHLSVIVVHRAADLNGVALVVQLRRAHPTIPIILVSGRESCPEGILAGASTFLNFEAWLRIGTVVAELLQQRPEAEHDALVVTT